MDESKKNAIERNLTLINECFGLIIRGELPTEEIIKKEFASIRLMIDTCEDLATQK